MRRHSHAVVSALVLVLLSGCAGSSHTAATNEASAPLLERVAKIGVIAPLQSGQTAFGKGIRNSVQLAVDQANQTHLIAGWQIQVDARDDSSTPSVGAAAAASLASDRTIIGVVGTYNSGVAAQVAPILQAADIVEISPGNTNPTLTLGPDPNHPVRQFPNYFRTVAPDNIQGSVLADFAFNHLGVRRVAIVTEIKAVSKGLADDFNAAFTALGGTILVEEVVPAGTTDYTSILQQVAQTPLQLLFYGGEYNSGGTTVRVQSRAVGINVPMMGSDGLKDDNYIAQTGTASEGDFASSVGQPIPTLPQGTQFLAAYEAEGFSDPPSDFGPYAYDAANVILAALRRALLKPDQTPLSARSRIIQEVQDTQTNGVTGPISFNQFGDTNHKVFTVYQVQNGAWVAKETIQQ